MKALLLAAGTAIVLSLPLTAQAADDVTCASYGAMAPRDQMAAVAGMHREKSGMAATTGSMASHDAMATGMSRPGDRTAAAMAGNDTTTGNDTRAAGNMVASRDQMTAHDGKAAPDPMKTQSAANDSRSMAGGMSSKAMALQVTEKCNAHPESTLRRIFDELF